MSNPLRSAERQLRDPAAQDGAWHRDVVAFLPLIRSRADRAHCRLPAAEREEAVAEVTATVAAGYAGLARRGRAHRGLIPPLVRFAVRQRAAGRRLGTPANRRDALSPVPRSEHKLVSLESSRPGGAGSWRDALPDSRRLDPAELAAVRLDFEAWLSGLPARLREVAAALAAGESTGELARRLGVSPGRVSQFRADLRGRWAAFAGEPVPA